MQQWTHMAVAGLWGGLLAIERRAFLQAMLSRPLVASAGMGALLEDVESGLLVGMVLELYHLGAVNLGAALPDNETLSATTTAAAAATLANATGGGGTPAIWSIALLLMLPAGRLGRGLDRLLERYGARLATRAQRSAELGQLHRAVRQNLWGMWPAFVSYGLVTALAVAVAYAVAPWEARLPLRVVRGLAWAFPAMASVAAAMAVRSSRAKRAPIWAGAAAAVVTAVAAVVTLVRGGA